jgi:hypothetical protein
MLKEKGTFKADENAHPFVGEHNEFHIEPETRIEVILTVLFESSVLMLCYKLILTRNQLTI